MEKQEITRKVMLADMDIRRKPDGRIRVVSVKYVQKDGKLRFLPQCTIGGAGRMNNKKFRVRGFTPCDCQGNPEYHVHPVNVFYILEYNGKKVYNKLTTDKYGNSVQ